MDFLVTIELRSGDIPEQVRGEVLRAERQRGLELRRSGQLRHIWRLPGGGSSVGVWSASDADSLHEMLASLPIAPWTGFRVVPLARHPLQDVPDDPA
jgi:muconolactone D-isomerase